MVQYKLYYFDTTGRAEFIRILFTLAGKSFEDIRFSVDEWPNYKKQAPLGQAPFLEIVDDTGNFFSMGQSLSIARYLARMFGMAGTSSEEQALVESYGDFIHDLQNEIFKVRYEQDETRKNEMMKRLYDEHIPKYLKVLENLASKSSSGYLCKCGITWPDILLFTTLNELGDRKETFLTNFQRVKQIEDNFLKNPKVFEWVSQRQKREI